MAKMWDILFLALIIAFLFPDGRDAMRRAILSTGIVGSVDVNADEDLTYKSGAWILQDLNGAEVQLSELKGQAIFLNFWATWCGPCKAEMPSIEALYKDMGDEVNFLIVVCVEHSEEAREHFGPRKQTGIKLDALEKESEAKE